MTNIDPTTPEPAMTPAVPAAKKPAARKPAVRKTATAASDAVPATKAPARTRKPAAAKAPAASGLENAHVLLTGATGFVGQAVLERLLSSYPTTRISLLIRGKGSQTGESRLPNLMRKPVFSAWRERVGDEFADAEIARRVRVVEGSLDHIDSLPDDLDIVLHGASTVSFDPPIDEAFDTNVGGARVLYGALLASGSNPHVVHVSTAYVAGIRKGIVAEASLTHNVDWRAEAAAAASSRSRVELASRQPEALRRQIDAARKAHGKAGPQAVARAAEAARAEAVTRRLVDHGRTRAESLGWTDVYTLTKAFAERAAEELWAQSGHRLSVVRPAIIESALQHPFPGWIDGFKVADPLIIAYGRGQLPEFPGVPDSVLDIIPVDYVVNVILAAANRPVEPNDVKYFHVSSGASNPLPFHEMYENVNKYFLANPVSKDDNEIEVPTWRFPGGIAVEKALQKREKQAAFAERTLLRLPSTKRTREWLDKLQSGQHDLKSLRAFSDLYRAYVQTEVIFDDANTKALHAALPEDQKKDLGFDVTAIDWTDYFQNVHFPAITGLTKAFAARKQAKPRSAKALPVRSDVLAVFDLEGTVIESNLVQQYLWLRRSARPQDFAGLVTSIPRYIRAERRDRGEFIRAFLRRYEGVRVDDLKHEVAGNFGKRLKHSVFPEALRQVQAHREAGHRTVLVTGMIDIMAHPLAEYFDEVVAGSMHERDGVLTGYLATPPLVDEARASWLRKYAAQHGANLTQSYGYGDSHADLSWLELVGHANAVNPDIQLYRYAQAKRWAVHQWRLGRGAKNTPVAPANSEKGAQSIAGGTTDSSAASHGI